MQEHIRRAHPENYIPKLPATEESFRLMITTLPSDRPQSLNKPELSPKSMSNPSNSNNLSDNKTSVQDNERKNQIRDLSSSPNTPINKPKASEELQTKSTISTASAHAQIQSNSLEPESEPERVCLYFTFSSTQVLTYPRDGHQILKSTNKQCDIQLSFLLQKLERTIQEVNLSRL